MSDLKKAAQQALEALETYEQYIHPLTNYFGGPEVPREGSASAKVEDAITALRAALAQQEQDWSMLEATQQALREHMAEIHRLRKALEEQKPVAWMVYTQDGKSVCVTDNPADFTDKHRALPLYTHPPRRETEQEPAVWIQPDHLQKARQAPFLCRVEPTKRMSDFVAIYTTPPRREWQGLTDTEIGMLYVTWDATPGVSMADFARAIEAALKERNNG